METCNRKEIEVAFGANNKIRVLNIADKFKAFDSDLIMELLMKL